MSRAAFVLASGSPRRRELVGLLGSPFETRAPRVDEAAAEHPALAKARAARARGATTLAADTVIHLDGTRVGKPRDAGDAAAILRRLAGREHEVVTDVAVIDAAGRELRFAVASRVRMRDFARDEAERYAASGEPLDAAGAYKIQGRGGVLVRSVDGCFANVVGLPLCHVYEALRLAGRAFPERPERACQAHFEFSCPVWQRAQAQGRALHDEARCNSWSSTSPSVDASPGRGAGPTTRAVRPYPAV